VPVVVCGLGGEGGPWDLPASVPWERSLHGGERSLHELAGAIVVTGREVELMGRVSHADLDSLSSAEGAGPRTDVSPRPPAPGDVVIVPEGYRGPLPYARLSLTQVRRILLALGPPGLTRWPGGPGSP
jgi:hypothetical protein